MDGAVFHIKILFQSMGNRYETRNQWLNRKEGRYYE